MQKIFDPARKERMMRVACFGSGSGTNIEAIIEEEKETIRDGNPLFNVVAIFANKKCKCLDIAEREGIQGIYHDYKKFIENFALIPHFEYWEKRERYDLETIKLLEKVGEIDLICLVGYMLLATKPLIEKYNNKMINVHPADLSILDEQGKRKYTGDNAVYDAIKAGEKATRSTVHIVTEEADQGPILVRSKPLEVTGLTDEILKDEELFRNFADEHQKKQKKECDWPAYRTAVSMIADGRFAIDKTRVYVDRKHMPAGFELG